MWLHTLILTANASPAWSEAMATGDCPAVLAALPTPTRAPERLATARCRLRGGEAALAESLAARVTAEAGDLTPYAALTRGQALVVLGRAAEAVTVLAAVDLPGHEDTLARARALEAAGRDAEALTLLTTVPAADPLSEEARFLSGELQRESGAATSAVETWRALWRTEPSSVWADRAAERLATVGAPVPDVGSPGGRGDVWARAQRLVALHLADRAVPLLDALNVACGLEDPTRPAGAATPSGPMTPPVPPERVPSSAASSAASSTTCPASPRYLADTFYAAHQYGRAAAWYVRAGADTADAQGAFRTALSVARAGDYAAAADRYAALVARWPTAAEADEAAFKPGYMHYDAGRLPEAITAFTAYLAARPTGKFAADARWFRAWSQYKLGETAAALTGFDEVITRDGKSELAVAARYWRSRAKGDDAGLREVLRLAPESGYAYFAATRLNVHSAAPAPGAPASFPAEFLAPRPKLRTALALLDAGLPAEARPLLALNLASASAGGVTTSLAMADALVRAEQYRDAMGIARKWCAEPAARAACHPRPYATTLGALTSAGGLDPLLPYAIMNAESALDPSVTSPAGARGLMQLMPDLATTLAQNRVAGFVIDDLYRAGVNARLGTTELVELRARLGGLPIEPGLPLVIAAYNGGPAAVERWAAATPVGTEGDRFAEDISYTETRRYVRRVLGFLMAWRTAWGG